MKPLVILVHGFANPNGVNTTDKLRPYLEKFGFEVWEWDYGWKGLLGVRICNKSIAYGLMRFAKFASASGRKVYAVGHSNGCEVIRQATLGWEKPDGHDFPGAGFEQIALVDAALDNSAEFGSAVKQIHVYHNSTDWVVEAARFLPFHPWGNMGRVGYKGKDSRFQNHLFKVGKRADHNDFFSKEFVEVGASDIRMRFLS